MRDARSASRLAIILALLTPTVGAQIVSATFEKRFSYQGAGFRDAMGTSVSPAGDVNGDGYIDVIVGSPGAETGGLDAGSVSVYSGVDGTELWRFDGNVGERLGSSVAEAGDVDQDGFADVVVGAPSDPPAPGRVLVLSGRSGTVLRQLDGPSPGGAGRSVAGGVDVNRDGFPDVIVGAPYAAPGGRELAGSVLVYSGRDGTVLWQFHGEHESARLGIAVARAGPGMEGDVNHDGFADVIVGAHPWLGGGRGSVSVYSGRTGSVLWQVKGTSLFRLGTSVAGAGDIDGDGFTDVIIGAPSAGQGGSAFVYSLINGLLLQFDGRRGDGLGIAVAGAGDVDQDGVPDLLVGAEYANSAFLYSGRDGRLMWRFDATAGDKYLGFSVAGAGDIDGDGFRDVILGAGKLFYWEPGSAYVHLYKPSAVAYGTGLPGTSNFTPILRTNGLAQVGRRGFWIQLTSSLGGAPCLIAGSTASAQTSLLGLTLYGDFLTPGAFSTWSFTTGGILGLPGTGWAALRTPIPNDPSLIGFTTYWQGFVADPGSPIPLGVSHTGGLAVTVVR